MHFGVFPLQTNQVILMWVWLCCNPDLTLLKQMVQKEKKSLLPSPMGKAQTYLSSSKAVSLCFGLTSGSPELLKDVFLKIVSSFLVCPSVLGWASHILAAFYSLIFSLIHSDWEGSKRLETSAVKDPTRAFWGKMQMSPGIVYPSFIFLSQFNA